MVRKMVKREIASIYVDYFLKYYKINKKLQPNLKESILLACENPQLEITSKSLNLDEINKICVNDANGIATIDISSIHKNINSISDFAKFIVEKIMELENEELLPIRIFNLERKMDAIKEYFEDMGIYHEHLK